MSSIVKKATITVSNSNLETKDMSVMCSSWIPAHYTKMIRYQMIESVDRNEGMVSMVVMTALRTMAKETQTLSAKAALLEDGSSSRRKSFRLNGFWM